MSRQTTSPETSCVAHSRRGFLGRLFAGSATVLALAAMPSLCLAHGGRRKGEPSGEVSDGARGKRKRRRRGKGKGKKGE